MSTQPRVPMARLALQFPMSLAVYPDYEQAQRAVDYLSDHEFPVQNCMIVGTDLKQVERVTGRLTSGKVFMGGAASGMWFGALIGFLMSAFSSPGGSWAPFLTAVLLGAFFGIVWAWLGYSLTKGRRDFTSVSQVIATRYEVLVEHAQLNQARQILSGMSGPERAGMYAAGPGMPPHVVPGPGAHPQQQHPQQQQQPPYPQAYPQQPAPGDSVPPPPPSAGGGTGATSPGEAQTLPATRGQEAPAAPYRTYGEAMDAQRRAERGEGER